MSRNIVLMLPVLAALISCGSDAGEILLACDYRASSGECSEIIRGSGAGTFEGDCTNEVDACPTDGIVATCTEEDQQFAYEVIYYYANADLVDAQDDCEFFDGIWEVR